MGVALAQSGRDTLICETEGKSALGGIFGLGALGFQEERLLDHLWARTVKPDEALLQYLEDHAMLKLSRYLVRANLLDYVSTTIPGIKDVIVLGKVKQLVYRNRAYERPYENIILDPPAAGHAVTFLSSAVGIKNAVRMGPLREQADEVLELLRDHEMTAVHIVTLPEETPVNEAIEAASKIVERTGCKLGVVFVNGCYPRPPKPLSPSEIRDLAAEEGLRFEEGLAEAMSAAASFLEERYRMQREEVERIASALKLPVVELPFLFTTDVGIPEIEELARAIAKPASSHDAESAGVLDQEAASAAGSVDPDPSSVPSGSDDLPPSFPGVHSARA